MELQQIVFYLKIALFIVTVFFEVIYGVLCSFINTNINYICGLLLATGVLLFVANIVCIKSKAPQKILPFIGENLKKLIVILLVAYISKQLINKDILDFANKFYNISLLVLILYIVFFIIDRLLIYKSTKHKINDNYAKFLYYFFFVLLYIIIVVDKYKLLNLSNIIIWLLFFNSITVTQEIRKDDDSNVDETSDVAISNKEQLFQSRQRELEYIIKYIEEYEYSESFAISIAGDWGEGKSSLLNVLKKEISIDNKFIISIQPMIVDSRESLVKYFYNSMESLFKGYGIFTGKGSPLKKYFDCIIDIIGGSKNLVFDKLIDSFSEKAEDYRETKKDLQKDISQLIKVANRNAKDKSNRIIILIDDFDRVDEQVSYIILSFIKEIVDFKGCMVIFLMDYKKLKNTKMTYEYLDKFINKRFDLKKLNRTEVVSYFLNKYLDIEDNLSKDALKEQLGILKKNIEVYFSDTFSSLKEMVNSYEKAIDDRRKELNKSKGDKEKEEIKTEISKVNETIRKICDFSEKINDVTGNTRKMKKMLRDIRDTIKFIDIFYSSYSEENLNNFLQLIECNKLIFRMIFIKTFLEKEFDSILDYNDLSRYLKKNDSGPSYYRSEEVSIVSRILYDISEKLYISEKDIIIKEKTISFINNIFINSYTYESLFELETELQKCLKYIDNDSIRITENYYENIAKLYDAIMHDEWNVRIEITQQRLSLVEKYIFEQVENGNIKPWEMISLINPDKIRDDIISINIAYLRRLRDHLHSAGLVYEQEKDKIKNIYTLKTAKLVLSAKNNSFFAFLLSLAKISDKQCSYESIFSDIKQYDNLEGINGFAQRILNYTYNQCDRNELEKFGSWMNHCIVDIQSIADEYRYIDMEFLRNKVNELLEMYSLIEHIDYQIKNTTVKEEFINKEFYGGEQYEELRVILERLKVYLEDSNHGINHNVYSFFQRLLIRFEQFSEKTLIDSDVVVILDTIYDILKEKRENKFMDILAWEYCGSKMIKIKVNQNRLRNPA